VSNFLRSTVRRNFAGRHLQLFVCALRSGEDWVAWQPGTLPGGPVDPPARWATTSDPELGQTT